MDEKSMEEFKDLRRWVQKCPAEAAMRIEDLEQKVEMLTEQIDISQRLHYKEFIEATKYRDSIKLAMENTHDDDTHEFLNRVLQGKCSDGCSYRLNT